MNMLQKWEGNRSKSWYGQGVQSRCTICSAIDAANSQWQMGNLGAELAKLVWH